MKKTILTIVVATLCLFFSAKSQQKKATDITYTGLQIGQRVPEVYLENLHNYKTKTSRLSDFKGKLLILDFWATWCSPCIAMLPKMDSLQTQFDSKIQFLSVTYQPKETVLPFLETYERKKGKSFNIPVVTGDQQLNKLFPHLYLPHYVWIGTDGTVKAITEHSQINAVNIEEALNQGSSEMEQKKDMEIAYQKTKPLFIDGNGGNGASLIAHSLLSGYTEGLPPGYTKFSASTLNGGRIILRNLPLLWFFKAAYTQKNGWIANNRMLILVKDPSKISSKQSGNAYNEWLKGGNGYCYELIVPTTLSDSLYVYMQSDLKRYFPEYISGLEKQERTCWVLQSLLPKTPPALNIPAEMSCDEFIQQLNTGRFQDSEYPLVNGTNNKNQRINFDFRRDFKNISELNELLKPLNLKFVKREQLIDILTIRDRK